ncbi:MAG: hypothetical protein II659_08230 [Bacteroidales bacterium]|nr:hypothetical protein [Bacteroidales bacterium]
MEKEVNVEKLEKIKKLTEEFLAKNYGETLEHFYIAEIIGEKIGSNDYRYVVRKTSEILMESGKAIRNVRGVGYKIVSPDEYLPLASREMKGAYTRVKKANKILNVAPEKEMSPFARQALNEAKDHARVLENLMGGARATFVKLSGRRENPYVNMIQSGQR